MEPDLPILAADRLFAAAWADEPLPAVCVALDSVSHPCPAAFRPPFPVIGLGSGTGGALAAVDVIASDPTEARTILRNCARNPQAAAVLVQLLRLIGNLPLSAALAAESMAYGLLQAGAEHRRWLAQRMDRREGHPAPAAEAGAVAVDRTGDVMTVLMDRPAALNAIDRAMRDALREAFDVGALDPEITRIVLAGRGRSFSVGAELAEFGTTTDPVAAHAVRLRTLPAHALAVCGDKLEVRVHGACVGSGLEMAAFARTLVATPDAWFQLPELSMGLIPGAGGCVSVTRRIGRQATARLVLGGRRIAARVALDWGLVDRIVET